METSYSLDRIPRDEAGVLLTEHPQDYLLFGTDSPWADQAKELEWIRSFRLDKEREHAILFRNAQRLLGSRLREW